MGIFNFIQNLDAEWMVFKTKVYVAKNEAEYAIEDGIEAIKDGVEGTFFSGTLKEEALEKHEENLSKYNSIYKQMTQNCDSLYSMRKDSIKLVKYIEMIINSIANTPKEFNVQLGKIQYELSNFQKTEEYAQKAFNESLQAGKNMAAGAAAGVGIASMAPTALMSFATTFGTASTGTAISALSGAAAQKAAVAWIGRTFAGVAVKSGAGMLAGEAFLALAGPVGWGITAAATSLSLLSLAKKNRELAAQILDETKEIIKATNMLQMTNEKIIALQDSTKLVHDDLAKQKQKLEKYHNCDFIALNKDEQMYLGSIVNNTLSLAALLNKSIK